MNELVFMMGVYEAKFPVDRLYCTNHMWAQPRGDVYRFGFTAYAVRLLQDVYFLEWQRGRAGDHSVATDDRVHRKQEGRERPVRSGGRRADVRFNATLLDDPSAINVDKYGAGWLFEMRTAGDGFLSPDDYLVHLTSVWEVTQRTIKGQLN